jgi:hypothetical protein
LFTQNNGSVIGNTGTNYTSGPLGNIQGDATRNAIGDISVWSWSSGGTNQHPENNLIEFLQFLYYQVPSGDYHDFVRVRIDFSRMLPTANEIRPVNIAVRYMMRALP